jgi:hypothetical protein
LNCTDKDYHVLLCNSTSKTLKKLGGVRRSLQRDYVWSDDEDITPMDTNNTPQVDIQGPINHARARQLNLQVISFLRNYSCAFESSMLPNDLIVLRNKGEDQQGRGKDLGGVEDQRGRPDQDGSPNRFDFISVSDSRNSPY